MFAKYYENKSNNSAASDSEIPKSNEFSDSNKPPKCTCGWRCEYPESHVEHSKGNTTFRTMKTVT